MKEEERRHQSVEQVPSAALVAPQPQPQQTCLPTLLATGRWRRARILMNFSKLWVSPSPVSYLHGQNKSFLVLWGWHDSSPHPHPPPHHTVVRSSLGTAGRDAAEAGGGTLSFTGDKEQRMLNSILNRHGIVAWTEEEGGGGGGHNIIHVRHLSRPCINARGGLRSPVLFSCLFFFLKVHSLSSSFISTDGHGGSDLDPFNWVTQLCFSVSSRRDNWDREEHCKKNALCL